MDCPRHIIGEIERELKMLENCCGHRQKCLQAVYELKKQLEKAKTVFEMELNIKYCGMECDGK